MFDIRRQQNETVTVIQCCVTREAALLMLLHSHSEFLF